MRIEDLRDTCTGCGACLSACPKQCISFFVDDEGFYFPRIDKSLCVSCGKCERVCHCLSKKGISCEKHSYYGFSLDEQIRQSSTSGGVFASLAREILDNGGNVYGAAYDYDELRLKHTSTDQVSLSQLQKSKYLESCMGNTIAQIQRDLDSGRRVLFCGTPCQVAGVRHAIGEHEHLILCDFICHGVPSAEIFRDYILGKLHKGERLTGLDFRPKDAGWSSKNIRLVIATTTTTTPFALDPFYKGFMTDNVFLRRSCYDCQYRDTHYSDITIADFWGYQKLDPSLNDEKGLSLIVANTARGKDMVEALKDFELHEIDNQFSDYAFAQKDYSRFLKTREQFYACYRAGQLKKAALKTYMKDYYVRWAKYYIKKVLHRT